MCFFSQKKSYILDIESSEEASKFLTQNINTVDAGGNFIYLLVDTKLNIENFLTNKLTERYINTIVLNIKTAAKSRYIIDVYTKKYFSNNRRVEPYILGSFINNKFIFFDTLSRKMATSSFFPEQMRNLDSYPFTVSAFHYLPKVRKGSLFFLWRP